MALSTEEIDDVRRHLGYGNIGLGAEPYTPDGFQAVFDQIVSTYLSTGNETTSSTTITAAAQTTLAVADATGIVAYGKLIVDTGDQAEIVQVKNVSGTDVIAYFAKAHTGTYPVATDSGKARLRLLLWDADAAWRSMTDGTVGATAGLKQVDKGDVEWFQGFQVLTDRLNHYKSIVMQISSLVRVDPAWQTTRSGRMQLEAYS